MIPELIVFTGNIGTGKSTIARKHAQRGDVIVNMDCITEMIGGGDYGLYDTAKKEIYKIAERTIIETALSKNFNVVIDRTNMKKTDRARYIKIGRKYTDSIFSFNFGSGTQQEFERRLKNNREIPSDQWEDVYKKMQKTYEPPSLDEGFAAIFEVPKKFQFYAFDFDGTIVENKFPEIGEVSNRTQKQIDEIKKLHSKIKNIIIIWTCRSGDYLYKMKKFLIENKIPFDFINENPMANFGSPKIFADKYIDDRNEMVS